MYDFIPKETYLWKKRQLNFTRWYEATYNHRYNTDYDNPKGGIEMVWNSSKRLASNDTVEDQKSLHGEYIEDTWYQRAIVPWSPL